MPRFAIYLLCLTSLLGLVACGGGGGGGDGGAPDTGAPGSLIALAVEGDPAPDTPGNFAAFPTNPYMAVAFGGWAAFVAPTDDGTLTHVLYVLQPDATMVRVFAVSDAAPGLADGTIDSIQDLWMCEDGTVMAYVTIVGNTNGIAFGIVKADVAAGAATNKAFVIAHQTDISGLHSSFTGAVLDFIDPVTARKETDGTLWFLGQDSNAGETHLFSVDKDGTNLTLRTRTGQALNTGVVLSVDAFGVDPTGNHYVTVVTSDGGIGSFLATDITGAPFTTEIVQGAGLTSGGGTLDNVHKGGRINCNSAGASIWIGEGSNQAIDDVCLFFQNSLSPQPPTVLARTGDSAPSTGGGLLSSMNSLNTAPFARFSQFHSTLIGAQQPINSGTFAVLDLAGTLQLDTSSAIISGGAPQAAAYVSLRQTARNYDEVSADGSFLIALRWLTTSSLFWGIRETNGAVVVYPLAAQGGPAPNGDTFGSFEVTSAHTIANGVVMFRAPLATAGTGIFYQGVPQP